jgi:hypothetical protein
MTKSIHWKYENEWRMYGGSGFEPDKVTELNKFAIEDLTAIVFGARSDRKEAAALIKEARKHFVGTAFFFAQLDPNRYELELVKAAI